MTRFDIIKYYIDKYDYNGFFARGLSANIFDYVSEKLVTLIPEDENAWQIAEVIANVIDVEYGEEPRAEKFVDVADCIRTDLRRLERKIVINPENLNALREIIPTIDDIYRQNDLELLIDELDDFVIFQIISNGDEPNDLAYKYESIRDEIYYDNYEWELWNQDLWGKAIGE